MGTHDTHLSRRQFLKHISAAGLSVAGASLLAACGGAAPGAGATAGPAAGTGATAAPAANAGATTAPAAGSGATTVNFFARGDEAIFKVFREIRTAFNKENPDINVQIQEVPGDFYQKFQLQLASGTPPDALFECDCTISSSIRAGALAPLDDLMKGDSRFNKADYFDIAFYTSQFDGKTYGLPYDGGSMVIYYNEDLFTKAGVPFPDAKKPMSWDQLLEIGRTLTLDFNGKHPGEAGFDSTRIKQYAIDAPTWVVQLWIWGAGGEIITADGKVPIDEALAVKGLQFFADMPSKHFIMPQPQAASQQGAPTFLSGNVAMQYNGVWDAVRLRETPFKWNIAPFPLGTTRVSTGWYSPLSITQASKNKEAAWKWISFCCSQPGQQIVAALGQAVPPIKSLANSDVFLNPNVPPKDKQVFLDEMDPKILRTPGDKMGKYFGGYVQEFRNMFNPAYDAVWRGERTAAEVGKEMRPKLEKLLATGEVS